MGNRAAIKTESSNYGIYLHWNGGVESVLAFLEAAKQLGVRDPANDDSYCMARLTQIIGNFFGGELSLGIGANVYLMDYSDNGVFTIGKGFTIINREGQPEYDTAKTVAELDKQQKEQYEAVLKEALERNAQFFTK